MQAIINGKTFEATTFEQVSRAYRETIEMLGLGASETPRCLITKGGKVIAHVTYNGRVWPGKPSDWSATLRPLYDPL